MINQYYSQIVIFYHIANLMSLTKAAKHLKCSKAHISKQLSDLERLVGHPLMHRNTRSLSLTFAGEALFKHAESIINELDGVTNTIASLQNEKKGTLRITSPQGYADYVLTPHIPSFLKEHPDISLEMIHAGAYLNLVEEKIDVAIRITHEPSLDKIARQIDVDHMILCCSPDYLERHGIPRSPQELTQHQCLVYLSQKAGAEWPFQDKNHHFKIAIKPTLSSNSLRVLLNAAIEGLGIVRVPLFAAEEHIKQGGLQKILSYFDPPGIPIYALFTPGRIIPPRIHAFVRFLEQIHKNEKCLPE